jgi:hypothetical protein
VFENKNLKNKNYFNDGRHFDKWFFASIHRRANAIRFASIHPRVNGAERR